MWLVFALCSPFFWALVHVLDAHCVDRVFDRPWMGVITSSLSSLIIIIIIPFALPFVRWDIPSVHAITLFIASGALIQASQALYFQSLEYSEAGIVAAYWSMTPALLPIAAFILVGNVLRGRDYVGIALLIGASACFSVLDAELKTRWRAFFLMLAASIMQVAALLLMKGAYGGSEFFVGFLFTTSGVIVAGAAPLLLRPVREAFRRNMRELRPAVPMIVGIEAANLAALFLSQKALDLGIPSLVAAVETTIPAYTFGLSMFLFATTNSFGDTRASARLPIKLVLVVAMATGVWLVSDGTAPQ